MSPAKIIVYLIGLAAVAALIIGLAVKATQPSHGDEGGLAEARVHVVASNSIVADWVRQVAGDRVKLTVLLGPDSSPHHASLTPGQVSALNNADIVFQISEDLETWLEPYLADSEARRVRLAAGLPRLARGENGDDWIARPGMAVAGEVPACCAAKYADVAGSAGGTGAEPVLVARASESDAPASLAGALKTAGANASSCCATGTVTALEKTGAECSADCDTATALAASATGCCANGTQATLALAEDKAGCCATDTTATVARAQSSCCADETTLTLAQGELSKAESGCTGCTAGAPSTVARSRTPAPGGGAYDPHLWFDASLVQNMVMTLSEELAGVDPANRAAYYANDERYRRDLRLLDKWIFQTCQEIPDAKRRLITQHENMRYFARRYGFALEGSLLGTLRTGEADPSALAFMRLIKRIEMAGIPAVFAENVASPELPRKVAAKAGLPEPPRLITGALTSEGRGGTYIDMMRANTEMIVAALNR
jgi:ABC-type Zn uptake system ZnuABC Zn-binding protein ZnuA